MKIIELLKESELIGCTLGNGEKITSETAKKRCKGTFNCTFLDLTTLVGAPEVIDGNLICGNNKLRSLKDIHKIFKEINGGIYCNENPIKSHVLGVLYIKGVDELVLTQRNGKKFDKLRKVQDIINSYLPNLKGHKGVFECQCALQDADLDEYAQL